MKKRNWYKLFTCQSCVCVCVNHNCNYFFHLTQSKKSGQKSYKSTSVLPSEHQLLSNTLNETVKKMEVLKKLEEVRPNKPYHGFGKLSIGFHRIECFRVVKNKFGKKGDGSNKSILVELCEEVLFLPQYFWGNLTEDDIKSLNASINGKENVYLYFGGKHEDTT